MMIEGRKYMSDNRDDVSSPGTGPRRMEHVKDTKDTKMEHVKDTKGHMLGISTLNSTASQGKNPE